MKGVRQKESSQVMEQEKMKKKKELRMGAELSDRVTGKKMCILVKRKD